MKIIWHRTMAKTVRKFRKAGAEKQSILRNLHAVIALYEKYDDNAKARLRGTFRDHALKGSMQSYRELHLSKDDLLIYRIHDDAIELMKIISHEELRRQ